MPKGYWIARMSVRDTERYKDYITAATPAYQAFGAKFLVRGGRFDVDEGGSRPRNVIIEFPTYEAALACYNSEEYARARAIRREVADGELIVIEGHDS